MLKTIPENVPTHVVYLDLSSNDLNILNVTELNRLTELRELNLRSNQITKIIESAVRIFSMLFLSLRRKINP